MPHRLRTYCLTAIAWTVATAAFAQPVALSINEFVANHAGTDQYEYIEVIGNASSDYGAYHLLAIEGDATAPVGTIDAAIPVGTTDANGLWWSGFVQNTLENGTLTLLLVAQFSGNVGDDLDTNDDGVLDVQPWAGLADAVAVSDGGVGDRTYAATVLDPSFAGGFTLGGASREPGGGTTWLENDFDGAGLPGLTGTLDLGEAINTPGTANEVVGPCEAVVTPIPAIQGSGAAAAITGTVTVRGVVVGDYEGPSPALRGFYLQDPDGDGDPTTSDAIFVFNGNADGVDLGDLVAVTGTAGDFQDQTQVSAASVSVCGTGTVAPVDVLLPVASSDHLERYEGMLVRFPQTLTVTEHFQLGRFGQVVVSSGGRLDQPTQVAAPGAAALAVQAANDLNRLIVDDAWNDQNPDPIVFGRAGGPLSASNTLRGGDTVTGAVGVLTYTWAGASASGNAFRLRPIGALGGDAEFVAANPRPATAPEVAGTLRVGALNVLNYFDTVDGLPDVVDNCTLGVGGTPIDCRGADDATELERQADKLVAAILGMDVAVVGLIEIENDGYGADSAITDLVDRLNAAAGAGTWTFVDADARTGTVNALGVDAIKVGLAYRPALVAPVGTTAVLDSDAFVTGGDAGLRNRPALAQSFQDAGTGGVFAVVVNHLKSKGAACDLPDAGDGQGECSAVRTAAAGELVAWLANDPTGTGDPDVLLLGDLNAYALEDPVTTLVAAGFTNLLVRDLGADAYGYAFDGAWGTLDHALASPSLAARAQASVWHVNADEPSVLDYNTNFKSAGQITTLFAADAYRASDHDPVVVGLDLASADPVTAPGGGGTVIVDVPAGADRDATALWVRVAAAADRAAVTLHGAALRLDASHGTESIAAAVLIEDANQNGRADAGEPVLGRVDDPEAGDFTIVFGAPRVLDPGASFDMIVVLEVRGAAGTAAWPVGVGLAALLLVPFAVFRRPRRAALAALAAGALAVMAACTSAAPPPEPNVVQVTLAALDGERAGGVGYAPSGLPLVGYEVRIER